MKSSSPRARKRSPLPRVESCNAALDHQAGDLLARDQPAAADSDRIDVGDMLAWERCPAQKLVHARLSLAGAPVHTVRSLDDLVAFLGLIVPLRARVA